MKKKIKYFLQSAAILAGVGIVCASVISCTTNNSNGTANDGSTSQFSATSNSLNLYTNSSNGIENGQTPVRYISIKGNFTVNPTTKNDYFGLVIAKSGLTYDSVNQVYQKALSLFKSSQETFSSESWNLLSSLNVAYVSGFSNMLTPNNNSTITTSFQQINNSGSITFNLAKVMGTYLYSSNTTYSLYLIAVNKNFNSQNITTEQEELNALPTLEEFNKVSNFNINLIEKQSWGKFNLTGSPTITTANNQSDVSLAIKGDLSLSNFEGNYYSFVLAPTPSILDSYWAYEPEFTSDNITSINSSVFSKSLSSSYTFYVSNFSLQNVSSSVHTFYLILVVANSTQSLTDGNFELYQNVAQVTLNN